MIEERIFSSGEALANPLDQMLGEFLADPSVAEQMGVLVRAGEIIYSEYIAVMSVAGEVPFTGLPSSVDHQNLLVAQRMLQDRLMALQSLVRTVPAWGHHIFGVELRVGNSAAMAIGPYARLDRLDLSKSWHLSLAQK